LIPNFQYQLFEVLKALQSKSAALIIGGSPALPTNLKSGCTPDPFHSDDHAPIGRDHARILCVVIKAIELALGIRQSRTVTVLTVEEQTLQQDHRRRQCWVIVIKRKHRQPVYFKGLFLTSHQIVLLSLHVSQRNI